MTTTDSNGVIFLEETDQISPFHTLINTLQQGTSDIFSNSGSGRLGQATSDQAIDGGLNANSYVRIAALNVNGVVVPAGRLLKIEFSGTLSGQGVGPFTIQVQIRRGSTTIGTGRINNVATNGAASLTFAALDTPAGGTYDYSIWLSTSNASVQSRYRGDLSTGYLMVEDRGTA